MLLLLNPDMTQSSEPVPNLSLSKEREIHWYVYILLCDNKTLYTGLTNDLNRRLKQHQNHHSTFTSRFKEIRLIYSEHFQNRPDAVLREKEIKGWTRAKKEALISGNINLLKSL